ncbi:4-hydroxythreonine-4-phosphate dehydrogenase [Roseobacter cerasinus]|uniref:4-hydroxythreonine-4-phosphate dehydrogenase n=1 Tax=Roseobacter cerasinus TaxID=2602289 RepID=A0A640VWT9_9RHOB|nr:4-hydroxythreonine-4-phosphate dehydrogenase PdxA [Roseobacter cerasinus]GFE52367.1 4-hydroxythreonine-4-phosphate dehydrogenase [Roseobacter cerasinus]
MSKKTIALVQGDPAGIGPELLIRLLSEPDVRAAANLVVIGAPEVFARGEEQMGVTIDGLRHAAIDAPLEVADGEILHLDLPIDGIGDVPVAETSAAGGRSSMEGLRRGFERKQAGEIDGLVFMPFNKESMHKGGNVFADELGFARDFFGLTTRASEFNVANGMWNGRVTSHVAMKDVPELLTIESIEDSIALADQTLRSAGYERPRIVVAAYNPHAGDGGLMGDEEIRVIQPAVEKARQRQINCVGPLPADTLWLKVRDGDYDAVVTMYHDQGQIAIKLLGFDRGVSVLAGLPLPITTPAHGTAFDIAGQAKANLVPTKNAFTMCVNMANNRAATDGVEAAETEDA